MSRKEISALERRFGMPHLSLRSPMSYPYLPGAVWAGALRNVAPVTGRSNQDVKAQNDRSSPEGSSLQEKSGKERNQRLTLDNVLCVGNDPAIFNAARPPARPTSCHNCGLHGSRRCSRCRLTSYCSVDCQIQDWKAHSTFCKAAASNAANVEQSGNKKELQAPTKPPSGAPSPGNKNEEFARKVMLKDLPMETLSEGTEMKGYISEFSSPSNFFIQAYNAKSVDTLLKLSVLNSIYSKPENVKKDYTPEAGEVCVARYAEDQQWYRALVYSVAKTTKMAQVLYLDFGNKENVPLADLRPIHRDVELAPPCAIPCCIAHAVMPPCGWSPECLIDIKRLLMGQQHLFRVIRMEEEELPRYSVEISLAESGERVSKIMQEKGYSFVSRGGSHIGADSGGAGAAAEKAPQEPGEKPEDPRSAPEPPDTQGKSDAPRAGERFKVLITVFHNPQMFFCQQVEKAMELAELCALMNQRYSTLPVTSGFLPDRGDVCSAQFTDDDNWYRASVVRHLSEGTVLVGYLDFGNTEALPISRLRPIDDDMLATPFFATQCCLAGVKPPAGTWTSETIQAIGRLLLHKVLTAEVHSESEGILTLTLIDESATPVVLSQHLIEAGLAEADTSDSISPGKEEVVANKAPVQLTWAQLPLGQETEVSVCMLQHPGAFFCHISNPTDLSALKDLNTLLGQYCAQHVSDAYTPVKGEVCGAFFTGDGNWYRGQVKDVTSEGAVVVQFLDYGNTEVMTTDKVCKIPCAFLELPFQAVPCSLAGVKPLEEKWDLESLQKFQDAVVGKTLRAEAVGHSEDGFSVELVASEIGKTIAEVLIGDRAALPDADKTNNAVMSARPSPAHKGNVDTSSSANSSTEKTTTTMVTTNLYDSTPSNQASVSDRKQCSASSGRTKPPQPTHGEISSPKATLLPPEESTANTSLASPEHSFGSVTPSFRRFHQASYSTAPRQRDSNSTSPAQKDGHPSNRVQSGYWGVRPVPSSLQLTSNPMPSPNTYISPRSGVIKAKAPSSSPRKSLSTDGTQGELYFSTSAPPRVQHYIKSSLPMQREVPASDSDQKGIHQPVSTAHPPVSPAYEDLPDSVTNEPSSAMLASTKRSLAQSWTSVELPLNEALAACVLKAESPDLIYVFPKENRVDVERLQQVMLDIFSYCKAGTEQPDFTPSVGDLCCAQFTADSQWYRAIVLDVSDSTAQIVYADYGNQERLPFSSLRPIKEGFLHPPVQTTLCRLHGVAPVNHLWSREAIQAVDSLLVAGGDLVITARSVEAGTYAVSVERTLDVGAIRVEEQLVMDGLAKRCDAAPLTAGCKENVGCCCQELSRRVEKLELLFEKFLQRES